MANKFARTVGGNWNTDATWSTTSGGAADTVKPTAADDVFLDASSGAVTIDAASVGRSLNCTGYTNVLTHNAFTLTLGDATAGASNIALKLVAGMTYTLADVATSAITFASTSATQQTIDCGGKNVGNITFGTSGTPNFAVTTAMTTDATATVTSTFGHLHMDGAADNSGLTHAIGKFVASASNVRTINLGTASITCSGTGVYWNMSTTANITFSGSSSTITATGSAGGSTNTFTSGNKSYGTLIVQGAGEQSIGVGNLGTATFVNLTRNGTSDSAGRNCIQLNLPANATVKVTGVLTVTGESAIKRSLVWPASNGVAGFLDVTGATLTLQYTNFQDTTFITAGTNVNISAITGGSGDCGGNTITGGGTLTFTSPTTQAWLTTGGGNVSDVTKWTSRIPLPQDSCVFNTAFSASPKIILDMMFTGSLDFTSSTGAMSYSAGWSGANTVGNITCRSGVTITNEASSSLYINSRGGTTSITANGCTWNATTQTSAGTTGNITFVDTLTIGAQLQPRSGTITIPSGVILTVQSIVSNANNALAIVSIVNNGTLNISSTGTIYSLVNAANLTSVTGSGIIGITNTGAASKTFAGGGNTYPAVRIAGGGSGAVIFTGANTFQRIYTDGGGTKSITLPGSTTTTILSHLGLNNGSNVITVNSSAGSATLFKGEGSLIWDYVSMTSIVAAGNSSMFAGSNSTDNGGNTGWIFTDPPSGYNKVTIKDRLNKFFSDKTGILNRRDAERSFFGNSSLDF